MNVRHLRRSSYTNSIRTGMGRDAHARTHTSNVIALSNQRMRTPLWLNKIMMSLCRVLKIIFHCQWFIASSSQMSLMVKRWTNVTALQTLSRVQIWRWPEHVRLCRRAATPAPHPVSVKSVQICRICVGSLVMKPWESPDDESAAAPAWNMEPGDRGRSLCRGSHTWEVAPQEESQEHEEWVGEGVNTSVCTFSGRARHAARARLHTCALERKHWWCWCSWCLLRVCCRGGQPYQQ